MTLFRREVSNHANCLVARLRKLTDGQTTDQSIGEISDLIDELTQIGEQGVSIYLLDLCFHSIPGIAEAASRCVTQLLKNASPLDLACLDRSMRHVLRPRSFVWRLRSLRQGDLQRLNEVQRKQASIVGLASFHPDGHVREEALRSLALLCDGAELPFILIRLNDWVMEVRAVARKAFQDRLSPGYAQHFVVNLSLVHHLGGCGRNRLRTQVRAVERLLRSSEATEALKAGCKTEDTYTRRACYRLACESRALDLCEQGLEDADPVVRSHCARTLLQERPVEALSPLLDTLSADWFVPIRQDTLRIAAERCPESANDRLLAGLLDVHAPVRELASWLLKKRTDFDFAAYYREQLGRVEGRRLVATILAIGLHGRREDLPRVLRFYRDGSPRVKRAVLRAVSRLDDGSETAFLVDAVRSEQPSVSKVALELLRRRASRVDPEPLQQALTTNPWAHVRKNAFLLLGQLGNKFASLYFTLLALGDPDEALREMAMRFVSQWIKDYNRSGVRPSEAQWLRVKKVLAASQGVLPQGVIRELEFCARPM